MFKLHVHSRSGDIDQEFEIEGDMAIIGRSSDCHVVIDRKDISRHHATLLRGWVVDDLNSRNGTYVGGAKLEVATLAPSRSFEIGDPTSENLVTIDVLSSDESSAPSAGGRAPGVLDGGPEPKRDLAERTTMALPTDSEVPPVAASTDKFESETERYRYKCAKLEVELEALRRKFDSFQKGGGDRRPASDSKNETLRLERDERR